ncbi:uncharacterized protein LOC136090998 [Hydra vulgaris]|uniref:Uncharacterized protein LOC136090998 n=1 Tax=Hydra vulgaris TaxID=6087 RepID=A0ABM4DHT0_HYDVU
MACGETVFAATIEEVHTAIYVSITVDGTPDMSHTEQIIFVLRFIRLGSDNQWIVKERFLKVLNLEKKKSSDIAKLIINVLDQRQIDLKNCRGQGYNNRANMSGVYKGMQAIVLEENPLFIPCSAHSLNIAGVHSAEPSIVFKNYFGNIQSL